MPSKQLALFRAGTWAAGALPVSVVSLVGQSVGGLVGRLPDYDGKRSVVASHMARVLGRPLARSEQRRMVADVFANYGRYWAESLRLPSLSTAEVVAGVVTIGQEHLEAALAEGRGVILAPPHLGGWEWGAMYLIRSGLPVTVAVEPLQPPQLFEWFTGFRERLGMQVVPVGPRAAASILRALKDNHIVCLLADRLVGGAAGVEVEFFGQPVMMPSGPVALAARSGAPLMAAAIYFEKKANSHTIVFRPPIELPARTRIRELLPTGAQALAAELEVLVRRAPTQWHLVQPNWPGDPELRHPWWAQQKPRAGAGGPARPIEVPGPAGRAQ
jgi:KDO2-lipid IV(A) lauroyltransferase